MPRLTALLAAAALLSAGPAYAAPKDMKSTLKVWETKCVDDVMFDGVSRKEAGKICKCSRQEVKDWIKAARGTERKMRHWSVYFQATQPEDAVEFYRQAAEAGLDAYGLNGMMMSKFFAQAEYFGPCTDLAQ